MSAEVWFKHDEPTIRNGAWLRPNNPRLDWMIDIARREHPGKAVSVGIYWEEDGAEFGYYCGGFTPSGWVYA